jgi:hypothetical protein
MSTHSSALVTISFRSIKASNGKSSEEFEKRIRLVNGRFFGLVIYTNFLLLNLL